MLLLHVWAPFYEELLGWLEAKKLVNVIVLLHRLSIERGNKMLREHGLKVLHPSFGLCGRKRQRALL